MSKMNKALIIIGVVLLALAIIAGVFTTTQTQFFGLYTTSSIPYTAYAIPLLVGGVVLIIAGAFTGKKK
jgi:uncharacterized membrane protein YdcZ (DUF606 family)